MAAPERFAEMSDSSCTAGAVHTWPVSTVRGTAAIRSESGVKADSSRTSRYRRDRPNHSFSSMCQFAVGNRVHQVLDNGKRYRPIYIDPVRKKIGSRHALRAVYTSQSVGKKQQQFWRQLRRIA
jgi:hypothetical protein